MLGCEIWLPMFCTVSMGDPWHSYVGSTSILPENIEVLSFQDEKIYLTPVLSSEKTAVRHN